MRSHTRIFLIGLVTLTLAAAACGGGEEGTGSTDLFETGVVGGIETDIFTPPAEEPPPAAEEPPPPAAAIELTVVAGQPIGPQSPAEQVAELQRALVALGFKIGKADGIYGEKTRKAVAKFQRNHNLEADGIVGPKTARAINKELQKLAAG